jgi:hypothetical protein
MSSTTTKTSPALADDLIWGIAGANGIAAELGIPVGRAYVLAAAGKIPVKKIGHRLIVASRRELRRVISPETT